MVSNGSLKTTISSITLGATIESRGHYWVYWDVERTGDKRLLSGSEESHPPSALTLTPPPSASQYCQSTTYYWSLYHILFLKLEKYYLFEQNKSQNVFFSDSSLLPFPHLHFMFNKKNEPRAKYQIKCQVVLKTQWAQWKTFSSNVLC